MHATHANVHWTCTSRYNRTNRQLSKNWCVDERLRAAVVGGTEHNTNAFAVSGGGGYVGVKICLSEFTCVPGICLSSITQKAFELFPLFESVRLEYMFSGITWLIATLKWYMWVECEYPNNIILAYNITKDLCSRLLDFYVFVFNKMSVFP